MQRFFPSEFGNDVDRVHAVEPAKSEFEAKAKLRRAIEAAGIPYTYVSANSFAGYFLPTLNQPGVMAPPRDKVVIFGDGNPKGRMHYTEYFLANVQNSCLSQLEIIRFFSKTGELISYKNKLDNHYFIYM